MTGFGLRANVRLFDKLRGLYKIAMNLGLAIKKITRYPKHLKNTDVLI